MIITAKNSFMIVSWVPFKNHKPSGIPTREEMNNRQALLICTSRQFFIRIEVEIVMATIAISGVAVFKPIITARSGIANMASANPKVDRSKVAKETIDNTRIVDSSKFIVILKGILAIQQAVI